MVGAVGHEPHVEAGHRAEHRPAVVLGDRGAEVGLPPGRELVRAGLAELPERVALPRVVVRDRHALRPERVLDVLLHQQHRHPRPRGEVVHDAEALDVHEVDLAEQASGVQRGVGRAVAPQPVGQVGATCLRAVDRDTRAAVLELRDRRDVLLVGLRDRADVDVHVGCEASQQLVLAQAAAAQWRDWEVAREEEHPHLRVASPADRPLIPRLDG